MFDILDIAARWSFWQGKKPRGVERKAALPERLVDSLALVVQGVRRSGKSTLMTQMMQHYGLDPAHCVFLNFEDPRLGLELDHAVLDALTAAFMAAQPGVATLYFFLDEIQHVRGWQPWLRTQLERPCGHHFILSGSNAQLLSGEFASSLTGRHQSVELFPFSFEEALGLVPGLSIEAYLHTGGFPEPLKLTPGDGDRLRMQYFADIVERDLRERVGARSSTAVKRVVQMAFESAGAELSMRRIAGATGMAVETAASYLEAAQAAYLLFACPFFAYSERKRATRHKKFYPIDPGLRRIAVTRTGEDRGKALECAVYLALRQAGLAPSYWRGDGEVDFVVDTGEQIVPLQVSWAGPEARHERALEAFYANFPHAAEAVFVSLAEYERGEFLAQIRAQFGSSPGSSR
ncbi:MAG: ATP-binding protein [Polyangiales bacterium]